MSRKSEVLTAVGTLGCAMGIGFVMQSSDVAEQRYGPKIVTASVIEDTTKEQVPQQPSGNAMLKVESITLTSAEFETSRDEPQLIPARASRAQDIPEPTIAIVEIAELQTDNSDHASVAAAQNAPRTVRVIDATCDIEATATPAPAAMVKLSVHAPCQSNERLTIHHNGMIFSQETSDAGQLDLTVPALVQDAAFIIAFSSGEGAIATTVVDDIADYDRAVLQWKGDAGFQIHAREFGAAYGTQGHLWEDVPGDLNTLTTGDTGFLTRQGSTASAEPLLAEVYTYPRNTDSQSGDVVLTVEAEVTAENCGIEVEAQALEMQPDGQVRTRNLILPVPSCDSVGSFLVLNNLLQDLKVAAK